MTTQNTLHYALVLVNLCILKGNTKEIYGVILLNQRTPGAHRVDI
jgi:hypothetical protein